MQINTAIVPLLLSILQLNFVNGQVASAENTHLAVDTSFLLEINGVEQYFEIKSVSKTKPVLLFVHGGPGWPATPMIRKYNAELANDFVLVSWDQRNCGKSKTDTKVILTPDVYVEDLHQLTEFLKKEFHVKKIFLACHSWGTIIGIKTILKYPGDYAAYIGMGQFVNPIKSESLMRNYVAKQATLQNDTATLNEMKRGNFSIENGYEHGFDDLIKFHTLAGKYLTNLKVARVANPTDLFDDYRKIDWFAPVMRDGKILMKYMDSTGINFFPYTDFKLPMYFFLGRYDYVTSAVVAEEYFRTIKAPKKRLYWFENSAHAPNWEEPQLFHQRLLEIAELNKAGKQNAVLKPPYPGVLE